MMDSCWLREIRLRREPRKGPPGLRALRYPSTSLLHNHSSCSWHSPCFAWFRQSHACPVQDDQIFEQMLHLQESATTLLLGQLQHFAFVCKCYEAQTLLNACNRKMHCGEWRFVVKTRSLGCWNTPKTKLLTHAAQSPLAAALAN